MGSQISGPGSLLMAQAVTYTQGQRINRDNSKERKEDAAQFGQRLLLAKDVLKQKKANTPEKGLLA
jgi:hypothetical protein